MLFTPWLTGLAKGWRRLRQTRHSRNQVDQRRRHPGSVVTLCSHFATHVEQLEDRSLLSYDTQSFDAIATLMKSETVTGVTIVTHGFEPSNNSGVLSYLGDGDSLRPLAEAIRQRADDANRLEASWLLDYDINGEGATGVFDVTPIGTQPVIPSGSNQRGEVVLLFDWAPESNENSDGWGEAAGDALFSMLVGLGFVDPAKGPLNTIPLHFIGHSFGTVVTSEAVERLATFHVPVDQVTYLDPHDFDETGVPVDGDQRLFDLGQPAGYGATVWDNVNFTDVYYQTKSSPEGRPIPGAYNVLVNASVDGISAHSQVWKTFYSGTVPANSSNTGYRFSRIADPTLLSRPTTRTFYGDTQNHEHSSMAFVNQSTGTRVPGTLDLTNFVAHSATDPLTIVNGDFEHPGAGGGLIAGIIPGWSHHGGGGNGRIGGTSGNHFLDLDVGNDIRTHNRFFVPNEADFLSFRLRRTDASDNDTFKVLLDQTLLRTVSLTTIDDDFRTILVPIPNGERNKVHTLTFEIDAPGLTNDVDSKVFVDDVRLVAGIIASTDSANIARLQRRLNELGFPDLNGNPLAVDGIIGPKTASAIRLFKTAIDPVGPVAPASDQARPVAPAGETAALDDLTLRWLNSPDAPRWKSYTSTVDPYSGTATDPEKYGTDWLVETVASALGAVNGSQPVVALSSNRRVEKHSLDTQPNGVHQSGMMAEININGLSTSTLVDLLKSFQDHRQSNVSIKQFALPSSQQSAANQFNALAGYPDVATTPASQPDGRLRVELRPPQLTVVSQSARDQLQRGLQVASATVGQNLDQQGAFSQTIGLLGFGSPRLTLADALSLDQTLSQELLGPLANYLASTDSPTSAGLQTYLANQGALQSGDTISFMPRLDDGQVQFDVLFNASRTTQRKLLLTTDQSSNGLEIRSEPMLTLNSHLTFDFTVGIDSKQPDPQDAFFLQGRKSSEGTALPFLTATATIDDSSPTHDGPQSVPLFEINAGLLGLSVEGETVKLNGQVIADPIGQDRRLTLRDLNTKPLKDILSIQESGSVQGELSVHVAGGLTIAGVTGSEKITFPKNDPFGFDAPAVIGSSTLKKFLHIKPVDVFASLQQVSGVLENLPNASALGQSLAFVDQTQLGDVLKWVDGWKTGVLGALKGANDQLNFTTLQDLLNKLGGTVSFGGLVGNDLRLNVNLNQSLIDQAIAFHSNTNLGELANLQLAGQGTAQAKVGATFTVGINLDPVGSGSTISEISPLSALNGGQGVMFKRRLTATVPLSSPNLSSDLTLGLKLNTTSGDVDLSVPILAADTNNFVLVDQLADHLQKKLLEQLAASTAPNTIKTDADAIRVEIVDDRISIAAINPGLVSMELKSSSATAAQALGFAGNQVGPQNDLRITLSDGSPFDVRVDGLATVQNVKDALNAAASGLRLWDGSPKFTADFNATDKKFVLTDHTLGGDDTAFSIVALNGSMAVLNGLGLGIVGVVQNAEKDGTRILRGSELHGDSLAKHVFLVSSTGEEPRFSGDINLVSTSPNGALQLVVPSAGAPAITDGSTLTIGDGTNPATVFEFDFAGTPSVTAGRQAIVLATTDTAQQVARKIADAVNAIGNSLTSAAVAMTDATGSRVELSQVSSIVPSQSEVLTVNGGSITASAKLGLLGLDIFNGSISAHTHAEFRLNDPNADGKLTIDELTNGLSSFGTAGLLSPPVVTGSADLRFDARGTLSQVELGRGRVVARIPDIANLSTASVVFDASSTAFDQAKTLLTGLGDLTQDDIIGALEQVANYLESLEGLPFVTEKIPGLNRSLNELLGFRHKFLEFTHAFRKRPAATLNELSDTIDAGLRTAFGIAARRADEARLVTLSIDTSTTTPALRIQLNFVVDLANALGEDRDPSKAGVQLPINVDLAGFGLNNLVSLSGTAMLDVLARLTLNVGLGIELDGKHRAFVQGGNDTRATFETRINGSALNFTAAVGPLGLSIENGSFNLDTGGAKPGNEGRLASKVETQDTTIKITDASAYPQTSGFTIQVDSERMRVTSILGTRFTVTRGADGTIAASHESGATAQKGSVIVGVALTSGPHYFSDGSSTSDFGTVSVPGAASVVLPFKVRTLTGNKDLNDDAAKSKIEITISNLANIGGTTSVVLPDFSQAIRKFDFDLSSLKDGWDGFFRFLETALSENVLNQNLPLIGTKLHEAVRFVEELRRRVTDNLSSLATEPSTLPIVRQKLFEALSGLGWLKDSDDPGTDISVNDVGIIIRDKNGNAASTVDANTQRVEFAVKLGSDFTLAEGDVDLDLGLPALGLTVDGKVTLKTGFDFNLAFGVDRNLGAFFDTTKSNEELKLYVDASLPGLQAKGKIGFLELTATDQGSNLHGQFAVNLTDPSGDGLITSNDFLGSSTNAVSGRFSADANARVKLALEAGLGSSFPSIRTVLDIGWNFDGGGSAPTVSFNDIQINPGEFIRKVAGPVIEQVNKVLAPLEPLIDVLTKPIPIVSLISGGTLLDLAVASGKVSKGTVQFIRQTKQLIDLAKQMNSLASSGYVTIAGSASFDKDASQALTGSTPLVNPNNPKQLTQTPSILPKTNDELLSAVGNGSAVAARMKSLSGIATDDGKGLEFPFLTNPASVVGLLFGQDVTLFHYDMPALKLEKQLPSIIIPIAPPFLTLIFGGVIGASADFNFGFDTRGLRQAFSTGDPGKILNGFYVDDRDARGVDVLEAQLYGGVTVAAAGGFGIDLGFASVEIFAGARGGIFATFGLNLNDPNNDGKVYLDEIAQNLAISPLAVFDFEGKLSLVLDAFIKVKANLGFVSITYIDASFPIADITLLNFSVSHDRPAPAPKLGEVRDGKLVLFTGPNAGQRVSVDTTDTDENFTVSRGGSADEMIVSAFGVTNTFRGVTSIYADGGAGNDTIVVGSDVLIPVELRGGAGNDKLQAGRNNSTLRGGDGDDELIGGGGDDVLLGDAGNDRLIGNDGNDTLQGLSGADLLDGGAGADELKGGDGNDTLRGQAGDDNLSGARGEDSLEGGAGNDSLDGGVDDDFVDGGDGNDSLLGDNGRDTLFGGAGDDRIDGNSGNDSILGNDGRDTIDAGANNDTVDGGAGNDEIRGGPGTDLLIGGDGDDVIFAGDSATPSEANSNHTIIGGLGNDVIYGDLGNDNIFGDDTSGTTGGDDRIFAFAGTDVIFAGAGNDQVDAGDGNDTIHGEAGNDTIQGGFDSGNDAIFGDDGDDQILSGPGTDVIYAGTGADFVDAGSEADTIFGEAGNDSISGGDGNDQIDAGAGNDLVFAGAGNDFVIGGTGDDTLNGDAGLDMLWGGSPFKLTASDLVIFASANVSGVLNGVVPANSPLLPAMDFYGPDGEGLHDTNYESPLLVPAVFAGLSVDGTADDGRDVLRGGQETDWLFGGGDQDDLNGDAGNDYVDGGAGNDNVRGGDGDDVVRGGANNDVVHGDAGIDQLYGEDGADNLFGDAGTIVNGTMVLSGQRLWGGEGIDYLWAYAPAIDSTQYALAGDELHGGGGGDWLYGNIRSEFLVGDGGNDTILGDYLIGPDYATNVNADTTGGNDTEFGDSGEDKLYGGGGDDELRGGADSDWLEGQAGGGKVYGGAGTDMIVLSTLSSGTAKFSGRGGHRRGGEFDLGVTPDAGVEEVGGVPVFIDILMLEATAGNDSILVSQNNARQVRFDFTNLNQTIVADWRSTPTATDQNGQPLIEQFRISGLNGNDNIQFLDEATAAARYPTSVGGGHALDVSDLDSLTDDFVGVIDGGPGDDTLSGTNARDRIDGGFGSDVIYGFAGDDQLWGDGGPGQGSSNDKDILFGGQGNDDLLGGQGTNELYAWSIHPEIAIRQLNFIPGQISTTVSNVATLIASSPLPSNGRLAYDAVFALALNGAAPVRIFVSTTDMSNNTTSTDLIADINSAIAAATTTSVALKDQVQAQVETVSGQPYLKFRGLGSTSSIRIDRAVTDLPSGSPATNVFGIFVDDQGHFYSNNGDLNNDGKLDTDTTKPARSLEDTGLNRMLGGKFKDTLYGGTGLDFMDGGEQDSTDGSNKDGDVLINRRGELFSSLDGTLAGQEWKSYAQSTDKVWYYAGSNLDDEIHVDFVTEPGVLEGHHLITRLTNNNGNFTFDAQVNLDFNAKGSDGKLIWNPTDPLFGMSLAGLSDLSLPDGTPNTTGRLTNAGTFKLTLDETTVLNVLVPADPTNSSIDELVDDLNAALATAFANAGITRTSEDTPYPVEARRLGSRIALTRTDTVSGPSSLKLSDANGVVSSELHLIATGDMTRSATREQVRTLLPPEKKFLAIIVDALDGNDHVVVGPTVTKSVWIDAGKGDDRVEIASGQPILIDQTERIAGRNDSRTTAFDLGTVFAVDATTQTIKTQTVTGLTIDNPTDEDWYQFQFPNDTKAGDQVTLTSISELDRVTIELVRLKTNGDPEVVTSRSNDPQSQGTINSKSLTISLAGLSAKSPSNQPITYWLHLKTNRVPTVYQLEFTPGSSTLTTNDTQANAVSLQGKSGENISTIGSFTGLTFAKPGDQWFKFQLPADAAATDQISITRFDGAPNTTLKVSLIGLDSTSFTSLNSDGTSPAISLSGLVAKSGATTKTYYLQVTSSATGATGGAVRYRIDTQILNPATGQAGTLTRDLRNAVVLEGEKQDSIAKLSAFTGLSFANAGEQWFKFTLPADGTPTDALSLTRLGSVDGTVLTAALVTLDANNKEVTLASTVTTSDVSPAVISLARLPKKLGGANDRDYYFLKVTSTGPVRFLLEPSIVDPATGKVGTLIRDFSSALVTSVDYSDPLLKNLRRRDIIIGGPGNDVLQGGSGEEWIFGNGGNDVLTGGYDHQAGDLLWGGAGDDIFQILPDDLPLTKPTRREIDSSKQVSYVPTFSDRYDGGEGADQVLFFGGDKDRLGKDVPDHVALRYNTILHRYEVTTRVWDVGRQQFRSHTVDAAAEVTATTTTPNVNPLTADAHITIIIGSQPKTLTIAKADTQDNVTLDDLVNDINDQLRSQGLRGDVSVTRRGDQIVFASVAVGSVASLQITTDLADPARTVWHFADSVSATGSTAKTAYDQQFAFFTATNVEQAVIDTHAGNDEVHADPGYLIDGSEWGIDPEDRPQTGLLANLTNLVIRGGDGDDALFGGAGHDTIDGGLGKDTIQGSGGNDRIDGGGGNDLLVGGTDPRRPLLQYSPTTGLSEAFVFTLTSPLPGTGVASGIQLVTGTRPLAKDAVGVVGTVGGSVSTAGEGLGSAMSVGDVNGDHVEDFLLTSIKNSYLFFGPVDLRGLNDVTDEADVIFSQSIFGKPATRMGDINGDGKNDLVFVKYTETKNAQGVVTSQGTLAQVVLGSSSFDVNASRTLNTTPIVITPTISNWTNPSVSVLSWNGDKFADIVLATGDRTKVASTNNRELAFVYAGAATLSSNPTVLATIQRPSTDSVSGTSFIAIAAGDLNGDGLDDLLFGDGSKFYLHRAPKPVAATATTIAYNDSSVLSFNGTNAFAVGDLDSDGFADIAIVNPESGTAPKSQVLVYFGESASTSLATYSFKSVASSAISKLSVTSGDYNGDGRLDLAVLEVDSTASADTESLTSVFFQTYDSNATSHSRTKFSAETVINLAARGTSRDTSGSDLLLQQAAAAIDGRDLLGDGSTTDTNDLVKSLSLSSNLDINGDGRADLFLGSEGSDGKNGRNRTDNGRILVALGVQGSLPFDKAFEPLTNRTITGSGDYLVNPATGRPVVFEKTLASTDSEKWYRFTTLGDGLPGDSLSVGPESTRLPDIHAQSAATFPVNPAAGLTGYWPFNGDGQDASGNGHDLTLSTGTTTNDGGLEGKALILPNDNSKFAGRSIDDDLFDIGSGDFSVQAWVNFSSTTSEQTIFEKLTQSGGITGWTLTKLANNTIRFAFGGPILDSSLLTISNNEWHQIVVTRNSSVARMYFDNSLVGTLNSPATFSGNSTPLLVGKRLGDTGQNFPMNGRIDEIALWNRAITSEEVSAVYNGRTGRALSSFQSSIGVGGLSNPTGVLEFDLSALLPYQGRTQDLSKIELNLDYTTTGYSVPTTVTLQDDPPGTDTTVRFATKAAAGPWLYFSADQKLWRTQGTVVSTEQILSQTGTFTNPTKLTLVDNTLFFVSGNDLWKVDNATATTLGATAIKINTQPYSSIGELIAVAKPVTSSGSSLYFGANDQLMQIADPTTITVTSFSSTESNHGLTKPRSFAASGSTLYFLADDTNVSNKPYLWFANGSDVKRVGTPNNSQFLTSPQELRVVGSGSNFGLYLVDHRTSGSTTENYLVYSTGASTPADLDAPTSGFSSQKRVKDKTLISVGSKLYLVTSDSNPTQESLWSISATNAQRIAGFTTIPELINLNNQLFFTATNSNGTDLRTVDATGTVSDVTIDHGGAAVLSNVNGVLFYKSTTTGLTRFNPTQPQTPPVSVLTTAQMAAVNLTSVTNPVAVGSQLYFSGNNQQAWRSDGSTAGTYDVLKNLGASVTVSALSTEGDNRVTSSDLSAPARSSTSQRVLSKLVGTDQIDVTALVKAALQDGQTRLTLLLNSNATNARIDIKNALANARSDNGVISPSLDQTFLKATPVSPGVLVDVYAAAPNAPDGSSRASLLAKDRSLVDLRSFDAGTYFLRVFRGQGSGVSEMPQSLAFTISVNAPFAGQTRAVYRNPDRDVIHGGDGDDDLVGNGDLDHLFGDDGEDLYVADKLEVRPDRFGFSETITPPPTGEKVETVITAQLDPVEQIVDPAVQWVVAQAVGIPVTTRFDGQVQLARPIRASDLATLTTLDLSNRGVTTLAGLEDAVNLRTLILSNNPLSDLTPIKASRSTTGNNAGAPIGASRLETLTFDATAVSDLRPLSLLRELRQVSGDNTRVTDLSPLAADTQLRFLSLDAAPINDLSGLSALTNLEVLSLRGHPDTLTDRTGTSLSDARDWLHRFNRESVSTGTSEFGSSAVAFGRFVVIGDSLDDTGATDSGAVFVFDASSGEKVLTIPNPEPGSGDHFGKAITVVGNQILVGAPDDDFKGADAGAAYLFDPMKKMPVSTLYGEHAGDHFGTALAASGSRFVVSAPYAEIDANVAPNIGVVSVFDGRSLSKLKNIFGVNGSGSGFGAALTIVGDKLVIASPDADNGQFTDAGKVDVYTVNENFFKTTTPQPSYSPLDPNPAINGHFGQSVAGVADQIVIGAPGDHTISGRVVPGTVTVFEASNGQFVRTLQADGTTHLGDNFGSSITNVGTDIVVGTPNADPIGLNDVFNTGVAGKTKPGSAPGAGGSIAPPDGVVAWYAGDGNAADLQNRNDGTLVGGTAIVPGKIGNAFQFDGIDDFITLDRKAVNSSGPFTVSAWVKPNSLGTQRHIISEIGTENIEGQFGFGTSADGKLFFFRRTGSSIEVRTVEATNASLAVGVWTRVTAVYDGNSLKIYAGENGSEVTASGRVTTHTSTTGQQSSTRIGFADAGTGGTFDGLIDDVRIYNRALTPGANNEIAALANPASAQPASLANGLVTYLTADSTRPSESPLRDLGHLPGVAGSNPDAVFKGAVTYVPGYVNDATGQPAQAFHFGGTGGYVSIPDTSKFEGSSLSIEAWIKPETIPTGNFETIANQSDFVSGTRRRNFMFGMYGDGRVQFSLGDANGAPNASTGVTSPPGAVSANTWQHVAAVFDGPSKQLKLYVNGVAVASNSSLPVSQLYNATSPLLIGATRESSSTADFFQGTIDELTIYNRAIDFTDVGAAYLFDGASGKLLKRYDNPEPGSNDYFGAAVSAVGTNVLVGATGDDINNSPTVNQGSAYLFDGPEIADLNPISQISNLKVLDLSSQQVGLGSGVGGQGSGG